MKRCLRERVEDKFIKLLEANGQRWVELNMKNGDKAAIITFSDLSSLLSHW